MDIKRLITYVVIFASGMSFGYLLAKKHFVNEHEEDVENDEVPPFELDPDFLKEQAETLQSGMSTTVRERTEQLEQRLKDIPPVRTRINYHKRPIVVIDEENEIDDDEPIRDAAGFEEGDFIDDGHERDLSGIDRTEPYLISDREYSEEFPHHDKLSLYYYALDDTLCDDNEDIIDNVIDIENIVGWDVFKLLETQTTAWVRNERLCADYEICAVRGSFAEIVHGIGLPDKKSAPKALSPREKYNKKPRKRRFDDDEE